MQPITNYLRIIVFDGSSLGIRKTANFVPCVLATKLTGKNGENP